MTSDRPRILVSRVIFPAGVDALEAEYEVEIHPADATMPREVLLRRIADKEGLLCLITDRIDAQVIAAAPTLRVISNIGVGYDNIDVAAATARGILVTNTPNVLTEATADFTWALILATARRVVEGDRYVRDGHFRSWELMLLLGRDLHGATLGICGMGRIGTAVARRAAPFGMRVLYTSRRRLPLAEERRLAATQAVKQDILAQSDILTLHLPLTSETQHYIGRPEFTRMKHSAILINTSRGPIVDEEALAEALETGRIAGAGLDVFEREPEVHPRILHLPQVVLAPHLGSATLETRQRMIMAAIWNLIAFFRGEQPHHPVNPEVLREAPAR